MKEMNPQNFIGSLVLGNQEKFSKLIETLRANEHMIHELRHFENIFCVVIMIF
jgi:hypothetical protein